MKKSDYINGNQISIDSEAERHSDATPLVIHLLDQGYTHREIKIFDRPFNLYYFWIRRRP